MSDSTIHPETTWADPAVLPGQFEVRVQPDRDAVRMISVGELDLATTPQLRDQLDELIHAGFTRVVVDLRKLEFVDSTAVALLVNTHDAAQRDGWELSVIRGPRAVRRVFELTGTAGRLPFTGD